MVYWMIHKRFTIGTIQKNRDKEEKEYKAQKDTPTQNVTSQ